MPEPIASIVAFAVLAYVAIGVPFAVVFATIGVGRVDPVARASSRGFRLVVVPGAALLWPWLAVRWARGAGPRDERNAHRVAAGRTVR